jgi:hypothetical protein
MYEKVAFNSEMTRWIVGENVSARGVVIPNDFSYRPEREPHAFYGLTAGK